MKSPKIHISKSQYAYTRPLAHQPVVDLLKLDKELRSSISNFDKTEFKMLKDIKREIDLNFDMLSTDAFKEITLQEESLFKLINKAFSSVVQMASEPINDLDYAALMLEASFLYRHVF
jgi:NADH dehydrogenase/NADH:ubiquinone oxidoreductase subunit G